MTAITTPQRQERFRTIPCQNYFSFPEGFKPKEWKVNSYMAGFTRHRKHTLTLDHFDTISYLKKSSKCIHALGHRIKEDSLTFLILEKV